MKSQSQLTSRVGKPNRSTNKQKMSTVGGLSTPLHKHRSELLTAPDSAAGGNMNSSNMNMFDVEEATNVKVYLRLRYSEPRQSLLHCSSDDVIIVACANATDR